MKKPDIRIGLLGWLSPSLRFETHQRFGQIFQSRLLSILFKLKVLIPTCLAKYQSVLQVSTAIRFSYPVTFGVACCDDICKQLSKFLTRFDLLYALKHIVKLHLPFGSKHHHQTQTCKTIGVSCVRYGWDNNVRIQKYIHFNNLSSCEQREPANLSGSRLPAKGAV